MTVKATSARPSGTSFLAETFLGKERLADSVNRLLLVGFYLTNGGWVARSIKDTTPPWGVSQVIENVATSYGGVLLILGVMHFGNLYVLTRMRRRAIAERGDPARLSSSSTRPQTDHRPASVGASGALCGKR